MAYVNYRLGECIKYTSTSVITGSTVIRLGVISAVEGTDSIIVTRLNVTDIQIPTQFCSISLLNEGDVPAPEVVLKAATITNILVLCQRFYNTGQGLGMVDCFQGMSDIFAIADSSTRDCFKIPHVMNVASLSDLKCISHGTNRM